MSKPSPTHRSADLYARNGGCGIALMSITLVAVCMILSDGFLTPAVSVVSAAQGIQYQSGISNGAFGRSLVVVKVASE